MNESRRSFVVRYGTCRPTKKLQRSQRAQPGLAGVRMVKACARPSRLRTSDALLALVVVPWGGGVIVGPPAGCRALACVWPIDAVVRPGRRRRVPGAIQVVLDVIVADGCTALVVREVQVAHDEVAWHLVERGIAAP